MNSKLDPTDLFGNTADESGYSEAVKSAPAIDASASSSLTNGANDSDEVMLAKAQTLMIDHPFANPENTNFELPTESFKYVQGVVQGQRVYIVTNLLGESEILFQPQMVWTFGRNREAALPLKDRVMSRRHAVLLYIREVGFQLIDLNSMNGSFVNGVRIQQRQVLKDGDRIRLGSINFTFFVSRGYRSLDAIHPEVLARFNDAEARSADFMDFAALEDPEILFKVTRE